MDRPDRFTRLTGPKAVLIEGAGLGSALSRFLAASGLDPNLGGGHRECREPRRTLLSNSRHPGAGYRRNVEALLAEGSLDLAKAFVDEGVDALRGCKEPVRLFSMKREPRSALQPLDRLVCGRPADEVG